MRWMAHIALLLLGVWIGRGLSPHQDDRDPVATNVSQASAPSSTIATTLHDAATSKPSSPKPSALEELRHLIESSVDFGDAIGAAMSLTRADYSAGLDLILAHRSPYARSRLLSVLFREWAKFDRQGALAAALSITSPQLRVTATRPIMQAWVEADRQSAWRSVLGMTDDPALQKEMIDTLIAASAPDAFPMLATWANQIEDPFLRLSALERIGTEWRSSAVEKPAGDPFASTPPTSTSWRPEVFRAALDWIRTIEPASVRTQVMRQNQYRMDQDHLAEELDALLTWPDREIRVSRLPDVVHDLDAAKKVGKSAIGAFEWLLAHVANPDLQATAREVGARMSGDVPLADLFTRARQLPAGVMRDAFLDGVVEHRVDAGAVNDAVALLPLMSRSYERDMVIDIIAAELGNNIGRYQMWLRTLSDQDRKRLQNAATK